MLSQLFQEIEIEANLPLMNLYLSDEAQKLVNQMMIELKPKPTHTGRRAPADNKIRSPKNPTFYHNLRKEVVRSQLDVGILSNEDNLETLIHLFDGQTILRSPVFFSLFSHWFDSQFGVPKIDRLFYLLKKKANLVSPGPWSFSKHDVIRILSQYAYLKVVFTTIKKWAIKRTYDTDPALRWKAFMRYLKRKNYFDMDTDQVRRKVRYLGQSLADILPDKWLKKNLNLFTHLAKYDAAEIEFQEEIKLLVQEKRKENMDAKAIGAALKNYLKDQIFSVLTDTPPYDLSIYSLSIYEGVSRRQIRRVIDNNEDILSLIEKKLSDHSGLESKIINQK